MPFGQVVLGPPGSGKSTYCQGMQQFLGGLEQKPILVNLDPANEHPGYDADLSIDELVTVARVMKEQDLGPNGAMIYCIEHLARHLTDWLAPKLKHLLEQEAVASSSSSVGPYFVFDCPGQVELYTHNEAMQDIIAFLQKMDFRLVVVHMVDSHHMIDPDKCIAIMLLSLKTMMQMGLPHINVLSKLDLMETYEKLPLPLSYYTQMPSMEPILDLLTPKAMAYNETTDEVEKVEQTARMRWQTRHLPLSRALCKLIEEQPYVSFYPLYIEDKESVAKIVRVVDKANGYIFGGLTPGNEAMLQAADRDGFLENVDREREQFGL